jgi:hypothetical protein
MMFVKIGHPLIRSSKSSGHELIVAVFGEVFFALGIAVDMGNLSALEWA